MTVERDLASALAVADGAGSGWNHRASGCFAREENDTGWIDSCYQVKQYNTDTTDGTSTRDIFALHHYATAKSKSTWYLTRAKLESYKSSGSPTFRQWVDWSPRSDQNMGSCTNVQIGVAYSGVGFNVGHGICDKWNITKWAEAGHFANRWEGGATRTEREVVYMTSIKVSQGQFPSWSLSGGCWSALSHSPGSSARRTRPPSAVLGGCP